MSKCLHLNFAASVDVARITENGLDKERALTYHADVKIECADCGEPFCFVGFPMGLMPDQPTISADEKEARLVLRPESETVKRFGPGFLLKDTPTGKSAPKRGVN